MTDRLYDTTTISRRKVLAGLGTIGLASAGAGLGTTAFFSDRESVRASLEAGRMDLLMDYRATYSPWDPILDGLYPESPDVDTVDVDGDGQVDAEGPIYVVGQSPDLRYEAGNDPSDNQPLSGEDWAAATEQIDACSSVSYPFTVTRDDGSTFEVNLYDDSPAEALPKGAQAASFMNTYVDGAEGLMFDLDDVKPKDRGEATMSLHLCDNPAYLWAQPFVNFNDENVRVEAEVDAGDDADDANDNFDGELADYLHVNLWYDQNCNNVKDPGVEGQDADVVIVFDRSGSMDDDTGDPNTSAKWNNALDGARTLVNALGPTAQIGLVSYAANASLDEQMTTTKQDVLDEIDDLENNGPGGLTNIEDAVDTARAELTSARSRAGAQRIMVFLTNGTPTTGGGTAAILSSTDDAKNNEATQIYTIAYGSSTNENLLEDMSTNPTDDGVIDNQDPFAFKATDIATVENAFREIAAAIGGEICIWEGSLAGLLADLGNFGLNAFPLDGASARNCALNDPADVGCFEPGVSCIAFEWYVPCTMDELENLGSCYTKQNGDLADSMFDELVDRGVLAADGSDFDINVVQTDTVEFGARFAAVQCRHNMTNPSPFAQQVVNGSN